MKLKILVAVSALLASGVSIADSYQSEVAGFISRADIDGGSGIDNGGDVDTYGVYGVYHFDAVNTANVPLAEAAYLGKNSNVYGSLTRASGDEDDVNTYAAGARFFIPESFLYVEAGAQRSKYDGFTDDDWYSRVGVTPIDGLLVSTVYSHDEGYDPNVSAKYVTGLGAGEFLNVEATIVDGDSDTYLAVGADYYLDASFSIGGELENVDSDNAYTVRTRKFFTEQFSGELAYTDAPNGNQISVGAAIRF